MLYARYVHWTGDLDFAREHWPTARNALHYLELEMRVKQGYLTYGSSGALSNQGWKDSGNCIVYSTGELAKAPIAVCEAQGYLYAAWREVAVVADKLGHGRTAVRLNSHAAELKKKFNRDFWMPEHGTAALALDGDGRQCDVIASNAGHLLGTGILPPEREKLVAARLMKEDMFSGWGIRTLADSAAAYQPLDYQVGAVWPHDNGMIVHGMCQVGESASAHKVIKAMLDVAVGQSDLRLPELFAGFSRSSEKQPVPYQVACVPQLWAAGCAFHMVAGLLGLSFEPQSQTLNVTKASLPDWLPQIKVNGLKMGSSEVDLTFNRTAGGATTVEITRVRGSVRCLVEY
jgi:glycogen debranching enzyme